MKEGEKPQTRASKPVVCVPADNSKLRTGIGLVALGGDCSKDCKDPDVYDLVERRTSTGRGLLAALASSPGSKGDAVKSCEKWPDYSELEDDEDDDDDEED